MNVWAWRRAVVAAAIALGPVLWPAGARAQIAPPPPSARLGAILEMARASDPQFAAARAVEWAARERVQQAAATLRPAVNLSLNVRRNRDGSSNYPDTLSYEAEGGALTVTQPLWRLVNVRALDQAEVLAEQARWQLLQAEQDLRLRVARAYFDVLQAQDELAAATAQRDALQQQLAQARRSFEVGTVPITDLNEAQARADLGVAQEIASRNDLASRARVVERLIGRPLPRLARLIHGAAVDGPAEQVVAALAAQASDQAFPVLSARAGVRAAELELERRSAAHQPTLDLVGTLRRDRNINYGVNGGTNTRQSSVGLELTVPLYQGGGVSAREREAAADLVRTREELENARRQASLDADQARLALQSGAALVRALQQAQSSSETQLRSTQRGQQVGVRTRVDVLNAEQQLFATRRDLASARYRTLIAGLALRAAAGALADADLMALDGDLSEQ